MLRALFGIWLLTAVGPSYAAPVPESGWPFCQDRDELKEFVSAMMQKNTTWMQALKTCVIAKPGLEMVTIEDFESDTEIGHVAKVRLISRRGGRSFVGYTVKLRDGPRF